MADGELRVAVAGLGYFSRFHLNAWATQPGARLVGLCDRDPGRLAAARAQYAVAGARALTALLRDCSPDIVDIVAPPDAHGDLIRAALAPGRLLICQKPFCRSLQEARQVMDEADAAGTAVVIHENFRFQPWYRQIRRVLESGRMGQIYQARFALRPGDGRGPRAYLDRQPAFQTMPRLLIQETGVHFVDLFRWLLGDIRTVYAQLRRLNPAIAGEDAGTMILTHVDGAVSVLDGNRLSDHVTPDPRRTMGEMTIEGEGGTLCLDGSGQVLLRRFGESDCETVPLDDPVDTGSFGGGCVAALIAHVVAAWGSGKLPENTARDYFHVMEAAEAAYRSAADGRLISLTPTG